MTLEDISGLIPPVSVRSTAATEKLALRSKGAVGTERGEVSMKSEGREGESVFGGKWSRFRPQLYRAFCRRWTEGGRENEMARISPKRMGIALGTQQSKAEHGGSGDLLLLRVD